MAISVAAINERCANGLPGLFGLKFTQIGSGFARARMEIRPDMLAPNGYLHGASVVALADTVCGNGCFASLPPGASNFTTIELKCNYLGTATEGVLISEARMLHGGRSTQVWDATVIAEEDERKLAVFRCTQIVLYPR